MQVVVGRIGRAHGTRGDVAVEIRTDEPELRFAPGSTLQADPALPSPLVVASARDHSGRTIVHFEDVDDRTAAESLRGLLLLSDIDPDVRPDDPDEYYDRQLIGLEVLDATRGSVGTVAEVVHLPGQELLAVDRPTGRQVLIPFVASIVSEVDLKGRQVTVQLPDGLLELADE